MRVLLWPTYDRMIDEKNLDSLKKDVRFLPFPYLSDRQSGPPSLSFNDYLGKAVMKPGHETDLAYQSGAEIENEWSYTASAPHTPSYRAHGQIYHYSTECS